MHFDIFFSFKQVKFNLLREESEGYAKLITELLDNPSITVSKALSRLYHLIGIDFIFLFCAPPKQRIKLSVVKKLLFQFDFLFIQDSLTWIQTE